MKPKIDCLKEKNNKLDQSKDKEKRENTQILKSEIKLGILSLTLQE